MPLQALADSILLAQAVWTVADTIMKDQQVHSKKNIQQVACISLQYQQIACSQRPDASAFDSMPFTLCLYIASNQMM